MTSKHELEQLQKERDSLHKLAEEYLDRLLKAEALELDYPNHRLYAAWFWISMALATVISFLLWLFPDRVWHWIIRAAYNF